MIRRALLLSLLLAGAAGTARATETMICSAADGGPEVSMLMGTLDVASIVTASIAHEGKTWATNGEGAMKIIVGQAFESETQLVVDFTDEALSTKVAELRLVKAGEEGMFAAGGTIRLPGSGAWAVNCSF
jgi:hypothetical protein